MALRSAFASLASLSALLVLSAIHAPVALAQSATSSDALPAGFAPSLWLGSRALVAGDTTTINAVAYDSSGDAVTGDMVFTVDGATISSAHFSLAAGASAIESVNWTATQGSHSIGAALANVHDATANTAAEVANETIPSVAIAVAAAPPPPAAIADASIAANAVNSAAQAAEPVASSIVSSVADAAESARRAGVAALSSALADEAAASAGQVLGTSTYQKPVSSNATSNLVAGVLASLGGSGAGRAIERGALVIFESAWLFYLVILIALLGFFWWLKRRLAPSQT